MTRKEAKRIAAKIKFASYTDAVNLVWKELDVKRPYEFERPTKGIKSI